VPPTTSVMAYDLVMGPSYSYNQQVQLPGIGSTAADFVVTLGPVQMSVCQQINNMLYGDAVTLTPVTSTGTFFAWVPLSGAVNDNSLTLTRYNGRPEGCVQTSQGNVYYKAVVER
jgi:hypothetical protein